MLGQIKREMLQKMQKWEVLYMKYPKLKGFKTISEAYLVLLKKNRLALDDTFLTDKLHLG
jgi:hypothetical protein